MNGQKGRVVESVPVQRLEREQVTAANQAVVEHVALVDTMRRVVGLRGVFDEDAGFEARVIFFADPG